MAPDERAIKVNDVISDPLTSRLWVCASLNPVIFRPAETMFPELAVGELPPFSRPLLSRLVPGDTWPVIALPPI